MSKNILKSVFLTALLLAAPWALAAEDGGQAGQVINFLIFMFKLIITAICLGGAGYGLYITLIPLLKRGHSEMEPGGQKTPWVKPMFLGLLAIGLVGGGIAMILKSSHVTENATGIQIQQIQTN